MLSFLLGKVTGAGSIKYIIIGVVVTAIVSGIGVIVYKNKNLEAKVTELSVANSSLIDDNNRYINQNTSLKLEIQAAYETRKAVDQLVSELQRNVSSLNAKSNEASNDIINYRKAPGITKCTVAPEWLSIYKNIIQTVNTAAAGMPGERTPGVSGVNAKPN